MKMISRGWVGTLRGIEVFAFIFTFITIDGLQNSNFGSGNSVGYKQLHHFSFRLECLFEIHFNL